MQTKFIKSYVSIVLCAVARLGRNGAGKTETLTDGGVRWVVFF